MECQVDYELGCIWFAPERAINGREGNSTVKAKPWRVVAAACIIGAGVAFVTLLYTVGLSAKNATERDFIEYWAAGQELLRGGNPYDAAAIYRLERATGLDEASPKVTASPPLVLLLAWPLGHLDAKTGLILWLLASLGSLAASVWILWLLNGKPDSRLHLIAFAFPPALACLMAGQLGNFFLLEVSLFLYFHKSRPWLAGAALWFFALKPHLFVLCFLVLLLWSLFRREFKMIGGFVAALAVVCATVTLLDAQAWSQYADLLRSMRLLDVFIPTLGVGLRFLVDRHARWLEFVPELAGCIWAVWYFWSRRERWNWLDHGLLLLIVSLVCTPYQWYTDQAMLFPAVLAGLYRAERSVFSLILFGLVSAAGIVGVFGHIQLPSAFYIWTAPAWLLWYLVATRAHRTDPIASEIAASAN
jgi:hypothetical protein